MLTNRDKNENSSKSPTLRLTHYYMDVSGRSRDRHLCRSEIDNNKISTQEWVSFGCWLLLFFAERLKSSVLEEECGFNFKCSTALGLFISIFMMITRPLQGIVFIKAIQSYNSPLIQVPGDSLSARYVEGIKVTIIVCSILLTSFL